MSICYGEDDCIITPLSWHTGLGFPGVGGPNPRNTTEFSFHQQTSAVFARHNAKYWGFRQMWLAPPKKIRKQERRIYKHQSWLVERLLPEAFPGIMYIPKSLPLRHWAVDFYCRSASSVRTPKEFVNIYKLGLIYHRVFMFWCGVGFTQWHFISTPWMCRMW